MFLALFFLSMYFGWLPDPNRTAANLVTEKLLSRMATARAELHRMNDRQLRLFSMLTELCLAMQRHDPKSVGTCSYLYQDQDQDHGGVP